MRKIAMFLSVSTAIAAKCEIYTLVLTLAWMTYLFVKDVASQMPSKRDMWSGNFTDDNDNATSN